MHNIYLDYSNIMTDVIGDKHGITSKELESFKATYLKAHHKLVKQRDSDFMFFNLPTFKDDLDEIKKTAGFIRDKFENVVLLGIGGSALGPFSIFKALMHPYYNNLSAEKRRGPKFYVMDNVDPDYIEQLEDVIDFTKTAFLVITKSGSTAETISSFMYMLGIMKDKYDLNPGNHFFFITDPKKGKLRELAFEWQVKTLSIPPEVGGRFSVLTPVGLLPAAILGIDIEEMLDGAAKMDNASFKEDVLNSPAYMFAIIHWLLLKKGKPIHVLFPYANSLYSIADWFSQLWAESLGKKTDLDNNEVFAGPTPVKTLGATDQHSQVQLYVEGPFDKVFTFMEVEYFNKKAEITGKLPFEDFQYLENTNMETLLNTEKKATEIALTENQRPNLTIKIPK
ncbi:MAG: glucose-6-phosphate isomerase, partial [Calditrichia bacterium]|nr:glucose-6-phosphate isomerase [Calditrichia bacterium]